MDSTADNYVTAWPFGATMPNTSVLNVSPVAATPNQVTVALGTGRKVSLFNHGGTIQLIVDVVGYYEPGTGALYHPLVPERLFDSRQTDEGFAGPGAFDYGFADLPADWTALALSLTGTQPSVPTTIEAWPTGTAMPPTSVLNLDAGQTASNMATVALGSTGDYRAVSFHNQFGSAHLIIDYLGYFGA